MYRGSCPKIRSIHIYVVCYQSQHVFAVSKDPGLWSERSRKRPEEYVRERYFTDWTTSRELTTQVPKTCEDSPVAL